MKLTPLFLILLAGAASALSDIIKTKDGSVLSGTVVDMTEGSVRLKTSFAGEIAIPMEQITSIETRESMPIHLKDGTVIEGTVRTDEGGISVVRAADQSAFSVTPSDITAINPPAVAPPEAVKWTGSIVGHFTLTDGARKTKGAGLSFQAIRRAEKDRITLRGGYYYSEDEDDRVRDDQFASGKYDYFVKDKVFTYLNSRLDRDAIKDLDLRTTAGVGLGYQFLENDIHELFGETGVSFVSEDYGTNDDDDRYAAGRIAGGFSWWLTPEKLRFEENAEFLFGFEGFDNLIAISTSSLVWQWTEKWSTRAGVRFDWDNTPARGQERLDTKLELGLGYSF